MAKGVREVIAAFVIVCSSWLQAQDFRIFHIDVHQADATLFVAPGGNTLLVDSGELSTSTF